MAGTTYIALLRAVNVGGRTVKMAALREHLTDLGYADVETYIQTGNVRFGTSQRSAARVRDKLEADIRVLTSFDVAVVLLTPQELTTIHAEAEAFDHPIDGPDVRRYVTFLVDEPSFEAAEVVASWDFENEHVRVIGRAVHWALAHPTHKAKTSNARLEKALGPGTTRDLRVVRSLAETWGR